VRGLCPVSLLFDRLFLRLLLLDPSLSGSRGLSGRGTRRIEVCSDRGKFVRKGVCFVSLLFDRLFRRLLLLDPSLSGSRGLRGRGTRRIEVGPDGGEFACEGRLPCLAPV